MQHVVLNNVARFCIEMLRAFGQALRHRTTFLRFECFLTLFDHFVLHRFVCKNDFIVLFGDIAKSLFV